MGKNATGGLNERMRTVINRPEPARQTRHFRPWAALLLAGLFHAGMSHGALPVQVDGQPLPSLAPMLEKVTPAVVNISSKTRVRVRDPFFDDPMFRRFFGTPQTPRERVEQSLGSGVIVDAAKGYVLTNSHVIRGADEVSVTLTDGRVVQAEVLGSDPDTDVAVLRIDVSNLAALPLADSAGVRVGDFVVAVGDPFGLGQTVTSGIVSALGRSGLRSAGFQDFIQTDASINPGNSGGALVNLRGELIGINSMIFSPSGGNVGIGFAIPSNLVSQVMDQLIQHGAVQRGALGVETQDVTEQLAKLLALGERKGAVITRVHVGSPAEHAGAQVGDLITAINGKRVASAAQLHNEEGLTALGAAVQLEVLREGKRLQLETKLTAIIRETASGGELDPRLAGIALIDAERSPRSAGQGVQASSVSRDSPAFARGLRSGDLVVAVNQRAVADVADLRAVLQPPPAQLLLTIVRDGTAYFLLLDQG